jgi:hypothetical protein
MRATTTAVLIALVLFFAGSAMAAAIQLPKTGQTECYNSGSLAVPCAGTGQDGELQRGVAWPDPRYTLTYCNNSGPCADQSADCDGIMGNNIVVDHLTGLTWMGGSVFYEASGSARKLTWEEALNLTVGYSICGGYTNWRVPNILEALSLSSYGTVSRPPVGLGFYSWTSTTSLGDTDSAWAVYGGNAIFMRSNKKTEQQYVTYVSGDGGGTVDLPETGQVAGFSPSGLDDGGLKKGTAWPIPRFTDNQDRTYTDQLTGIRWYKEYGAGWWTAVLDSAKRKNDENFLCSNQWIVPNIVELRSLFDYGNYNPALPPAYPFFLPPGSVPKYYWSSTSFGPTLGSAFNVGLRDGLVTNTPKGFQDGYLTFFIVNGTTPLCIYTLTANKTGSGSGTVTSSPSGINCGSTCSTTFDGNTVVTLTATPSQGSVFTGWSGGGCSGTGQCVVTMNSNITVTATFDTAPAPVTLTVNKAGTGTGTVTSDPAGINCGGDCSESYVQGTVVTLTATAAAGSRFTGWSGPCSGTGTCTVTMNSETTATATFVPVYTLTVTKQGDGTGTVTSDPAGINCGVECAFVYISGVQVTLTATAAAGSVFTGWSGCDTSSGNTCTVTMVTNKFVYATFVPASTLTVVKTGSGSGTVTSEPSGINCGADCSDAYPQGMAVTLAASPAADSTFTGWSGGGCSGTGTCQVIMNADTTVTAAFTAVRTLTVTKSGTGSGTVTSEPAGISCGTDCSESYALGTFVTLTAVPSLGSAFAGWSGGGCSGLAGCTVALDSDLTVDAAFTGESNPLDTWHVRASGVAENLWAAAYGNSTFVAVGEYGTILTSTDGVTWTLQDPGIDTNIRGVAYLNDLFVAVGEFDTILTSTDGITWTSRSSAPLSAYNADIYSVAHGNGTFVAVAKESVVVTSPDSIAWTFTELAGTFNLYSVAHGNDIFVAVGGGGRVMTTTDGTTWETKTSGTGANLWFITFGKGLFVGVGDTGTILTSTDGASWTARSSGITTPLWGISYGNDTFVASGPYGVILTSTNGTSWQARDPGVTVNLYNTAYGKQTFLALGESGAMLQSDPLAPPSAYTLTVTKSGTGTGTVTSEPAGISCGSDCSESYSPDTSVMLTATPTSGSTFTGWSGGGCSGTGTCTVTMTDDATVTATFTVPLYALTITKSGTGSGTVTSEPAGISCGSDCSESYPQGTSVTLTATSSSGSTFAGWSGGCSGTGTCTVTINSAVTANAAFDSLPCTYTLASVSKVFPARGGTVTVTITGKGQKTCPLPVITPPDPWLTITPPALWKNNRGTARITAQVTTQSTSRSATVTIGGTAFPVTQAGLACAVKKLTLTPTTYPKAGGPGTLTIQVSPQDCAWSAIASKTWISLLSTAGTGNDSISFTTEYNPTVTTRTGTISIILAQPPNRKGNATVRQAGR